MRALIWGAGNAGKSLSYSLPSDVTVVAFVDSNSAKVGTRFRGVPVVSPAEVKTLGFDVVYIANTHGPALKTYLKNECNVEVSQIVDSSDAGRIDHRRGTLNLLRDEILRQNLVGSVAEVGVYRGDFARYINLAFPKKKLILFDTFEGFRSEDLEYDRSSQFSDAPKTLFADTSLEIVREKLVSPENAVFRVGTFPESAQGLEDERYCFVSIDLDLYRPIRLAIEHFHQRLVPGGYIMLHDYGAEDFKGVRTALVELIDELDLVYFPVSDSGASVVIGKQRFVRTSPKDTNTL